MDLAFGVSAYQRNRGNLPELPVVNMFVEQSPTEPKQVTLLSRPGLEDNEVTSGAGPVVGIFKADGVLSGDLFTVSAGSLYREGVSKGVITGTGHVSMEGNEIGLAICAGVDVHYFNGTALGTADFPDSADVAKIAEIGGRFVALRKDTGKLYQTDVLEAGLVAGILTFLPLAFETAEYEPDPLVDICVVADTLVMGGSETVEFWQETGDSELPFAPIPGRVYEKGVRETGCLVRFDNTAAFLSGDGLVYRCGNQPDRISDSGIEERIADSATAHLFPFFFEGHEFLALRLDTETMVYDAQTQQWCEWATSGEDNFIGRCATAGPIFGSALDGKTLAFGDTFTDMGSVLERRFRAGLALNGGSLTVDNLRLRTNPGTTAFLTGQYANPVVEARLSRDGGNTWGNWRATKLGTQGQYRKRVEWRALGSFEDPGVLTEFRCSDPVDFRASGVSVNEESGGRSR